ncbi:transposable element Tcb1 transposase [Trichonephila clavipes]|nr:transposable element Tcb1 transposase [Trichonephila clavipes]
MAWGVIAYNTRSPLVFIRGTMTAQRYAHDILQPHVSTHATAPRSHFSTTQYLASHGKGVTRLYLHCYHPSLACPISKFVSNRAYLLSFWTASSASHEFERTKGGKEGMPIEPSSPEKGLGLQTDSSLNNHFPTSRLY